MILTLIGVELSFLAALGWLIQTIYLYIPKTNPSHQRNVLRYVWEETAYHKKQIYLQIFWLVLLSVGFFFQILDFII